MSVQGIHLAPPRVLQLLQPTPFGIQKMEQDEIEDIRILPSCSLCLLLTTAIISVNHFPQLSAHPFLLSPLLVLGLLKSTTYDGGPTVNGRNRNLNPTQTLSTNDFTF